MRKMVLGSLPELCSDFFSGFQCLRKVITEGKKKGVLADLCFWEAWALGKKGRLKTRGRKDKGAELAEELAETLALAMAGVRGCILCGSEEVAATSCFVPRELQGRGRLRVAFFGVCRKCLGDPNWLQRAEGKLLETSPFSAPTGGKND